MKSHDTHLVRLGEPALRGYVIAAAAALIVLFVVQFENGSVAAAGVPTLCGVAGLLLRWTAMPVALILTLGHFLLFPLGLPIGPVPHLLLRDSYLRLNDVILAAALLVYLVAQCRIFELTVPPSAAARETPASRRIEDNEIPWSFLAIALAVAFGQLAWWLIANLEPHFGADAPFRWRPSAQVLFRSEPSTQTAELSRFLVLVFALALVAGVARLAFWYLRLRGLTPTEARLILLDTQWQDNRRELARLETWRSYRLGHDVSRRGNADRTFRWVARAIVLAIFVCFLIAILYIYFTIE
jgi:hypothetical protein